MKSFKLLPLLILSFVCFSFMPGDGCESFFPQRVGSKWEMTAYNEKDKITSVSKSELLSVNNIDGGVEATIHSETFDAKGKLLTGGDVRMQCTNDKFYMDISGMMNQQQMEGIEGAEVELTNEFMEFPSNPVAGQTLPDVTSTMTVKLNGMQISSTTITITNRKVEGTETITTPAGTFNCIKFSEDSEVKAMMMKMKSHSIMWMAKNVGSVKIESYDEKGKLQSKNILTQFSN